jgi:hypothetical protein
MLEHKVRVAVGKHRVVAAAYDQNRLTDGAQNPVARVFRGAPADERFRLLTHDRLAAVWVSVGRSSARALQKGHASGLTGS